MKATRTWILIADGARARVVETTGKGTGIHAVELGELKAESRPSRELGDDRPGRVVESKGHQRHAIEPRIDLHRAEETRFAGRLVDLLEKRRAGGNFERLVIVAPPVMLGDIGKALGEALKAVISAEIAKDLTKVSDQNLMRHLEPDAAL
jgi:protein required for attachment to host cells